MAEQTDTSQLFHTEVKAFSEKIRYLLCEQDPTLLLLADSVRAINTFKDVISTTEPESFRSITGCMEIVLGRHLAEETVPTKIEIETIELAVDWLDQLALLYKENLPEPKSLVAELLYTFDLVERSHDAVSLADLVAGHAGSDANKSVDPFFEDPGFNVQDRVVSSHRDPFAADPGFGLEFDLLQRTVSFVVEANKIGDDPFSSDPSIDTEENVKSPGKETSSLSASPYDIFAGDPPLVD